MEINIHRHYRHSPHGPGGGNQPVAFWLIIKWLCLTAAVLLAAYLVEGIHVEGFAHALGTAAVLGVLNVVLRPVLFILTLPITIMTLGLFTFVLNALMLKLASIIPGFTVVGFWSAVFGALIISVVNWLLNVFIQDAGGSGPRRQPADDTIDMEKRDNHWE